MVNQFLLQKRMTVGPILAWKVEGKAKKISLSCTCGLCKDVPNLFISAYMHIIYMIPLQSGMNQMCLVITTLYVQT